MAFKDPTKVVRIRIGIFIELKRMSLNEGKPMTVLLERILLPELKKLGYETSHISKIIGQRVLSAPKTAELD